MYNSTLSTNDWTLIRNTFLLPYSGFLDPPLESKYETSTRCILLKTWLKKTEIIEKLTSELMIFVALTIKGIL